MLKKIHIKSKPKEIVNVKRVSQLGCKKTKLASSPLGYKYQMSGAIAILLTWLQDEMTSKIKHLDLAQD